MRICLIDDDSFVREALALGLSELGYSVMTAPGAAAGLDQVRRAGADAIVTDMIMPGTSGAQLIAEARAQWPLMPIVAISGAASIEGRSIGEVARGLGAEAVLAKPFRASELHDVLQDVMDKRLSVGGVDNA